MPRAPLNIVGPQVRRLRTAAGLSQPALAAACQRRGWDIERDTIAKIEGGTRWVCDSELIELAKALGVPLVELFPAKAQGGVEGKEIGIRIGLTASVPTT